MMSSPFLAFVLLGLMASDVCGRKKPRPNSTSNHAFSDEHRLMSHLMLNTAKINPTGVVRPVSNTSDTLNVKFGLALLFINNIDRESGMAEFKLWERFSWSDVTMQWNPEDYGGIDHIRIPMGKPVWKPDMTLYNSVDIPQSYSEETLGVLSYNGDVLFIPPVVHKLRCDIKQAGLFGNDVAYCTLKFGSWTYDGFKLDVDFFDDLNSIDVTDFGIDNRYQIQGNSAKKNVKYYPCCQEPYPDLTFKLEVKLL